MEAADLCITEPCLVKAIDNGQMDMFDIMQQPQQNFQSYTEFSQNGIPNYWAYPSTYTLADHMYSSTIGPKQSEPSLYHRRPGRRRRGIPTPIGGSGLGEWGCDAPSNWSVIILAPDGTTITRSFPCFDS